MAEETKMSVAAEPKKSAKSREKVYYQLGAGVGLFVPVVDENGNRVKKIHPITGQPIMNRGGYVYERRFLMFSEWVSRDPKRGFVMMYKTSDPVEQAAIEEVADAPNNNVMTEAQFKQARNPQAYDMELKVKAMEEELAVSRARELELERELEAATKPAHSGQGAKKN